MATVQQTLQAHGFTLEQTGGNCTAYVMRLGEQDELPGSGVVSITTESDPMAPQSLREPVMVWTETEEGEPIAALRFPTLRAALRALYRA